MYIKTTDIGTVDSYPYGRLRTTATFSLEFNPKRGFRSVFQTVNPKTGRLNKPKKGTYNDIMLIDNTDGFMKFKAFHFYHDTEFDGLCKFIGEHFELFTEEQVKYIYSTIITYLRVTAQSQVTYCGSSVDDVLAVVKPCAEIAYEGLKNPKSNIFNQLHLDAKKLEALKVPNYQPFKVTSYGIGA